MADKSSLKNFYGQCAYRNCSNSIHGTGHKMFNFPPSTDPRLEVWIKNSGTDHILKWKSSLRKSARICADHFDTESFLESGRRGLKHNAIPRPCVITDGEVKLMSEQLRDPIKMIKDELNFRYAAEGYEESNCDVSRIAVPIKTFRKVKRIKIEEQTSNSSRIMTIERCRNPETCPASRITKEKGAKPRPHFHKICVAETKPLAVVTRPSDLKKNSTSELQNTCRITKKYPSPSTSRYNGSPGPGSLMFDWNSGQRARPAPVAVSAVNNENAKRPSSRDMLQEYYRTREGKAPHKCAYINCNNTKSATGGHLFRFPQITDPRLTTWIKNTGNPRILTWSWTTIRRAGLCDDHFTDDCFFNGCRQRLLRTALPKPFYRDKNYNADDAHSDDLSQRDLLDIVRIVENEMRAEKLAESATIDLPSGKPENPKNLKIKYPFEELSDSDNDLETSISTDPIKCTKEMDENFAGVVIKTEPVDLPADNEILPSCVKHELLEEPEKDPLDNVMRGNALGADPDCKDNIREILALQQQKARHWKVIEEFSTMLKGAKIYEKHSRSRFLDYSDIKIDQ